MGNRSVCLGLKQININIKSFLQMKKGGKSCKKDWSIICQRKISPLCSVFLVDTANPVALNSHRNIWFIVIYLPWNSVRTMHFLFQQLLSLSSQICTLYLNFSPKTNFFSAIRLDPVANSLMVFWGGFDTAMHCNKQKGFLGFIFIFQRNSYCLWTTTSLIPIQDQTMVWKCN